MWCSIGGVAASPEPRLNQNKDHSENTGGTDHHSRPAPTQRAAYRHFTATPTRWGDNDAYGHVNNVIYYAYFDSAVNRYLIENGVLDIAGSACVGLVVETRCTYFSSLAFPDAVHVGLKVTHMGHSSVRYEIGVFRNQDDTAAAVGQFVHVYVDRASQRPVPLPAAVRGVLQRLLA